MSTTEDYLLLQKSFDVLIRLIPAIGAVFLIISSLFTKRRTPFLSIYYLTLIFTIWSIFFPYLENELVTNQTSFRALYLLFVVVLAVLPVIREQKSKEAEYYFLLLSLLFGSGLLLVAKHLIIVYVAIEVTSFSSYFLTSFSFKSKADESAIKYVFFGGMSSALMLFGIALSYYFSVSFIPDDFVYSKGIVLSQLLILCGFFFKSSLIPFHFWSPNVYQSAPVSTVTALSIVPKVSAVIALSTYFNSLSEELKASILPFLIVILLVSIIVGATGAIQQNNIRRMIAYAAIAQSGLIAVFALLGEDFSIAFVYYSIVYALANLLLFFVLAVYEDYRFTKLSSLSGLGRNYPFLGVLLGISLFSLIGLPPLAGFTAKFYLFSSVFGFIRTHYSTLWLVFLIVGILSTAISLYYYLKPVYFLFFKKRKRVNLKISAGEYVLATFLALLMFWLFIYPDSIRTFVEYLARV